MTSEVQGFLENLYCLTVSKSSPNTFNVVFGLVCEYMQFELARVYLDLKVNSSTAIPSREKELMRSMIDMSNLVCGFAR